MFCGFPRDSLLLPKTESYRIAQRAKKNRNSLENILENSVARCDDILKQKILPNNVARVIVFHHMLAKVDQDV